MPAPPLRVPTTLREHAGQCVMVRLGSNLPPPTAAEDDADRVAALLDRVPLGGVLLFRARFPDVAAVLARLQSASRIPLLVGSDVERGVGQQVDGATRFPHARAVGEGPDPEAAARTLARVTAREARACGIHWAFAPVADVNTFARNPIIGTRAFGQDADRVARCVRAYVEAARGDGLLTTAKHFPGHGRTATDSHATLPVVDAAREALEAVDLPPFQAAIDAGVDAVMTAHVAFPALDATRRPATASRPLLHDRLRRTMGFDGLVVSDSLLMEGAQTDAPNGASDATPGARAASLLRAGVDVLLDPDDPEAVVDGIVDAVESGALDADRVRDASARVWRLKERIHDRWGMHAFAPTGETPSEHAAVGSAAHRDAAARIARDAVAVLDAPSETALRDALPPEDDGDLLVLRVTPRNASPAANPPDPSTADPPDATLRRALRSAFPQARYDVVDAATPPERMQALRDAARQARHLVVACAVEPAAWHAFGLTDAQDAFVRGLVADRAGTRPLVLAALGSPHVLDADAIRDAPGVVRLCTYSDVPDSQQALVDALQSAPRGSQARSAR